MGGYSLDSSVTFRREDDPHWSESDGRQIFCHRVFMGYGRKWRREVGRIYHSDVYHRDDVYGEEPRKVWRADIYNTDLRKLEFSSARSAMRAALGVCSGGSVSINNSYDPERLACIYSRDYAVLWSDF